MTSPPVHFCRIGSARVADSHNLRTVYRHNVTYKTFIPKASALRPSWPEPRQKHRSLERKKSMKAPYFRGQVALSRFTKPRLGPFFCSQTGVSRRTRPSPLQWTWKKGVYFFHTLEANLRVQCSCMQLSIRCIPLPGPSDDDDDDDDDDRWLVKMLAQ